MAREWTKETLKVWFLELAENGENITPAQRAAIMRGLLFLYARQTADEQAQSSTSHSNGMGFSGIDAHFLSSVAKSAKQYGNITARQAPHVAKKLAKYTGQLLELVNAPAGWTPELERAAAMLPAILRMTPQEFEQWSVPHYLNDAREARRE